MPFLLDGNPTTSEISDALNYVLSNFNTSYTADPNTGQITGPTGDVPMARCVRVLRISSSSSTTPMLCGT